jgi:tyrosine-protein kinase Etk/Wzc
MDYEAPKLTTLDATEEENALNPWEFIEPFIKNRWIILLIMAITVSGSVLYSLNATPIYEAQSTIIIRRFQNDSPIRQQEINLPSTVVTLNDFNTKVRLIKSAEFAEELARRLIEKGHYAPFLKNNNFNKLEPEAQEALVRKLGNSIRSQVEVENPKMTHLVNITFQSSNKVLARDVVNTLADIVVEYGQKERTIIAKNNLAFLEKKLEDARANVEQAERELYEYRKKHKIMGDSYDYDAFQSRRNNQIMRMNGIQEERRKLESQISQLDALINSKNFTKYTAIVEDNSVLATLHANLVDTEIAYEKLLQKYKEKHPDVIRTAGDLAILRNKFNEELIKSRVKLEYDLNVIKAHEEQLQNAMDQEMAEAVASTEKDVEYVVLEQKAQAEKDMYNTLLQAVKEGNVLANISDENVIYVHEKAVTPERPVKPNKKLNLMLGLMFGLFLGVAFSYGREYLDTTVRNPDDVKKSTRLPVLSTVPLYIPKSAEDGARTLYVSHHPKSLFTESITSLRTHLNIKLPQERPLALIVTSSAPKEGKSLIASNLACSMALDGRRTLLLDADLHRPSIHKVFGMDKRHGLFDLIVDELNPRWSELDLASLNFGDLRHLIRLKQWSGTMKIQWDSLPGPLTITYQEGKAVSSNLQMWKEKFLLPAGSPPPVDPVFELNESEVLEFEARDAAGDQALEFLNQYPRLRSSTYFLERVIRGYLKDTEIENLQVLTAGTNPKNPNEILSSEQMIILLQMLKERYDRIIIDCPPAWPLSDVSVLSPLIDGVLWICRAGETPKTVFARNVDHIRQVQPNIVGAVINAVDLRRDRYYYYGYSYYYYRYYKSHYSKDYALDLGEKGKGQSSSLSGRA